MAASEARDDCVRKLFDEWYPRIYRLVLRWTGEVDVAEDLAQEIMIKVLRSAPAFRQQSRLRTWIYRIAFNHCVSWKRREFRRNALMMRWGRKALAPGLPEDPQARLEANGEARRVRQALAKLPRRLKEVLILRDVEERSYGQIAHVLRCSIGTVSSRLARARRALRGELE